MSVDQHQERPQTNGTSESGREIEYDDCQTFIDEFYQSVTDLMNSPRQRRNLFRYLERIAYQKNGLRDFDPNEVISDSIAAGTKHIRKNNARIRSAAAWIKGVGAKQITQQVREEIRRRKLREKHSFLNISNDDWLKIITVEECMRVHECFMQLNYSQREILSLRIYRSMSYKDIQRYYALKNIHFKLPTLRQRESRALKRLKELLHQAEQ